MQYLKDEVNKRILESALAEFSTMGYKDASMRKIARNAHVALGNVYHYCFNKQELFNTLVGPVYDGLMNSIDEINRIDIKEIKEIKEISENKESYFGINGLIDKLLEICQRHNIELLILMEKSKGCKSKYETTKQDLINLINEVLNKKMLPIIIDSGIIVKNEYITTILSAALIEGFCNILRKYNNPTDVKSLLDQLLAILFKDISSRF